MFVIFVSILLCLLGYLYHVVTRRPLNFPPGPPRWPIVGSLYYMFPPPTTDGEKPNLLVTHESFREKYGPIHSLYVGPEPVVIVSDYSIMSDLFKRDDAQGRAPFHPYHTLRPGAKERDGTGNASWAPGVIMSSGVEWQEQRRFALRQLREFGFGKSSMEELFQEEIRKLCSLYRRKTDGGRAPIDLHLTVNVSIINSLWQVLTGETFQDLEDPKLKKIAGLIDAMLSDFGPMSPASILIPNRLFPLPGLDRLTGWKGSKECVDGLMSVIEPMIQAHKGALEEEEEEHQDMRDFTDTYLKNVRECKEPSSSFFKHKGLDSLRNILLDLFIAGSDTTSTSLIWAVLYMIQHPEVQDKVQDELDRVCGRGNMPSLQHQKSLPYTNAVITEVFRKTSLAFMGVPHYALADIEAGGYTIPKGTTMFQNLYHVHHDDKYWKEPEKFDPTRFLDANGHFHPGDRIHPFGVGKRYCLGQSLAEKEFFLFFSGLVGAFRFDRVPGETLPGYGQRASNPMNVVRVCPSYRVLLKDRNQE